MPVRLKRLMSRGYFPVELPPPFHSGELGQYADELSTLWKAEKIEKFLTAPERFSHPRYGHARRTLSVVNPINQLRVSEIISENWNDIKKKLDKSRISEFRPSVSILGSRAVAGVDFATVNRKRVRLLSRYGSYIKTDIARFYGSVYTHSIPWALLGKDYVKQNLFKKAFIDSFANKLDASVRAGQKNQTIGIPIGPDTSRVLSELIVSDVEQALLVSIPDLTDRAVRYVDDFIIGFRATESPETFMSKLSSSLHEYDLELNNEKTTLQGCGRPHAPEWINFVRTFRLPSSPGLQQDSLDSYFEQAIHLADANVRDNVLLFALKRAASFPVASANWFHLIDWMLYCVRRSTACLSFFVEYLATAKQQAHRLPINSLLTEFIHEMLARQAEAAHASEVAWLLFCARELKIPVRADALKRVSEMPSSVCALLALDLSQRGLIVGSLNEDRWRSSASDPGLSSEMWLVAYEATHKNWWKAQVSPKFIEDHQYFTELRKRDIEFYDPKRGARAVTRISFGTSISGGGGGIGPYP